MTGLVSGEQYCSRCGAGNLLLHRGASILPMQRLHKDHEHSGEVSWNNQEHSSAVPDIQYGTRRKNVCERRDAVQQVSNLAEYPLFLATMTTRLK